MKLTYFVNGLYLTLEGTPQELAEYVKSLTPQSTLTVTYPPVTTYPTVPAPYNPDITWLNTPITITPMGTTIQATAPWPGQQVGVLSCNPVSDYPPGRTGSL